MQSHGLVWQQSHYYIYICLDKPHSTQITPRLTRIEKSPAAPPSTVTQNRRRYSNENKDETTELDDHFAVLSPGLIENHHRTSNNIFDTDDSSKLRRQASYEKLFQMTKKKVRAPHKTTDPEEPQLGKIRTPDKLKIARLKTAAPLLPARSTKPLTIPMEFKFSDRVRSDRRVSFDIPDEKKTHPSITGKVDIISSLSS